MKFDEKPIQKKYLVTIFKCQKPKTVKFNQIIFTIYFIFSNIIKVRYRDFSFKIYK